MEATFFICSREKAVGVRSVDDLPTEPVGEPLRVESTGVLSALARVVCADWTGRVLPLRDATCQSFPVFALPGGVAEALAALPEDRIDEIAQRWIADTSWQGADIDLYEIACLLSEIRRILQDASPAEAGLFVLMEEKAL